MKNVPRIVVILIMGIIMIIPAFSIKQAIVNTREYRDVRNTIEKSNTEINKYQTGIDEGRKAIKDYRGANAVDLENANALYDAVKALPTVSNVEANIISINGNNIKVMGDFNPKDANAKLPGIQLVVSVKDMNKFMQGLKELKTPYTTLNVIYPENKVVIRYNTQGGNN